MATQQKVFDGIVQSVRKGSDMELGMELGEEAVAALRTRYFNWIVRPGDPAPTLTPQEVWDQEKGEMLRQQFERIGRRAAKKSKAKNKLKVGGAEIKEAASAVEEAFAKVLPSREGVEVRQPTHPDPLGRIKGVLAATAGLRSESGRLSAQRIARVFDLSVAEVARLVGRSRQAVSKTDDAESMQEGLLPFARIARLRAVLSERDFRIWLNLPNDQLGGQSPRAAIRGGYTEAVADLADDMLTGSPV
jgi:hypothetical protein